jgi:phage terminase large subunit-like protein
MQAVTFFPSFNHTKGKMAGKPFVLAPFQQFTIYNVFAWKSLYRLPPLTQSMISALKERKTAEMAGLALCNEL